MAGSRIRVPNVLIADDVAASRELLAMWLSCEGYAVLQAEDGDQALEQLASHRVDIAILDVMMPRRNGFSTCRAIKSAPETRLIPVVLMTGLTSREDRIQGIECGADDFLNKPANREEVLARVRALLRLKSYTDEIESAETVVFALARSIEAKDPYTEGHCARLSKYSVALGQRIGLAEELQVALRRAGTVHDIGKVAVPESILVKAGPLTAEERLIMEKHPVVGESICRPLKSFVNVLPIIRHHHERMDGSGYPDGLHGEDIAITARIIVL